MASASRAFVPKALRIKIWGFDAEGRPFAADARTVQIAEKAVEVELSRQLVHGDIVGLTFRDKKGHFRVGHSVISGANTFRITLDATAPECMWRAELASPDVVVVEKKERRRELRYPVIGQAYIFTANGTSAPARLVDISAHGCYIETYAPALVGAELRIKLMVENNEVNAQAIVRTSHPAIGMGMEILQLESAADRERLVRILENVAAS